MLALGWCQFQSHHRSTEHGPPPCSSQARRLEADSGWPLALFLVAVLVIAIQVHYVEVARGRRAGRLGVGPLRPATLDQLECNERGGQDDDDERDRAQSCNRTP